MLELSVKQDLAVLYTALGAIGSLLGMAIEKDDIGKTELDELSNILNTLFERASQLSGYDGN